MTLTNTTIWFVAALCFIVDVRMDGHFYQVFGHLSGDERWPNNLAKRRITDHRCTRTAVHIDCTRLVTHHGHKCTHLQHTSQHVYSHCGWLHWWLCSGNRWGGPFPNYFGLLYRFCPIQLAQHQRQ